MKWTGKKVGLALGGGGARGLAHIGVINVLNKQGIEIDLIVGTSAGALIGGAYALGMTTREITAKTDAYLKSPEFEESAIKSVGMLFSPGPKSFFQKIQIFTRNQYYMVRALFRPSIMPAEDFQSLINYLIPDVDIRDTRIPFHAVTTDLITGKQVVLSKGSLRQAVLASCSVPGAVEPTRLGEWLLADGGVTSLVPIHAARAAGADVVIAVMVDRDLPADTGITTAKDVLYRAGEITANALEAAELKNADVIIHPAVGDLHWTDFSRAKDLVVIGEEATRATLEKIQASLPLTRRFSRFTQRFFKTEKNRDEIGTPGSQDKSGTL
jgi:NTE family protein